MTVSLFDMMRPVALFGGVGAIWGVASGQNASALAQGAAILGSLLAGSFALWISQAFARRVWSWAAVHDDSRYRTLGFACFYVAVFLGIAMAAYGGGVCGLIAVAAV
jgi:hypothetical protein